MLLVLVDKDLTRDTNDIDLLLLSYSTRSIDSSKKLCMHLRPFNLTKDKFQS